MGRGAFYISPGSPRRLCSDRDNRQILSTGQPGAARDTCVPGRMPCIGPAGRRSSTGGVVLTSSRYSPSRRPEPAMLSRRSFLASGLGTLAAPSLLWGQSRTGFNEREIVPQLTANDREDIWTLHIRFQDPRIIVEKVP